MINFDKNPFDRVALKDYRLLAGRNNEFKDIRFILRNAYNNDKHIKNILITGDKGVGKTSFLNLISIECALYNLIPVRVNLTEKNSINSNEFFWNIFNESVNTFFNNDLFSGINGPINKAIQSIIFSDGAKEPANWIFKSPLIRKNYLNDSTTPFELSSLKEDIKKMKLELTNKNSDQFNSKSKILFLVDESQNIYSNSEIIENLKFLIQDTDLGIGFVFAGDTSFEFSAWNNIFGSYRYFEIIKLNNFNDVESVIEYFRKSLYSIGWNDNEIEDIGFLRFKVACSNIFQLTSGKPAWINTIASKMFERCMKGESNILKFDRQSKDEVIKMLEESGQTSKHQLENIENLDKKYKKWLSKLFACEFYSFKQIYLYLKFVLIEDDYISLNEYSDFCKMLVDNQILIVFNEESESSIGYTSKSYKSEFLDSRFVAFNPQYSDAIKLWLQISSDGYYQFRQSNPVYEFALHINDKLLDGRRNIGIFSNNSCSDDDLMSNKFSSLINLLNNNKFDANEYDYSFLELLHKFSKIINQSRDKQILSVYIKNINSGRCTMINIFNYDDNDHLISPSNNERIIKKYLNVIENFNLPEKSFSINIYIDKIENPNLNNLETSILKTNDKKKYGILFIDKNNQLMTKYIKESNLIESHEIANFFYDLYKEGYDIGINYLNNSAYVYIAKDELDIASTLLSEALRIINYDEIESDSFSIAALILYNSGILAFKKGEKKSAINYFKNSIEYAQEKNVIDHDASVLFLLTKDNGNIPELIEIRDTDTKHVKLNVYDFALENIKVLES
jgi:hypothetical protein